VPSTANFATSLYSYLLATTVLTVIHEMSHPRLISAHFSALKSAKIFKFVSKDGTTLALAALSFGFKHFVTRVIAKIK
jgi:hypothetical protein